MKFILLFFMLVVPASASEITGRISTSPNDNSVEEEVESVTPPSPRVLPAGNKVGADIKAEKKKALPQSNKKEEKIPSEIKKEVLGAKIHPDGSLVRGSDSKIYLVVGTAKRYIATFGELAKHVGKKIFSVSDEELSLYDKRGHLDGELVRERGSVKVYVLINRMKKHILNTDELRAYYAGREIFNIFAEEMKAYIEVR
jgi:hypothetical protein